MSLFNDFDILSKATILQNNLSTPKPKAKSEIQLKAGNIYIELKRNFSFIVPVGPGILEIKNTKYRIYLRSLYTGICFFIYDNDYLKEYATASFSYSEFSAWEESLKFSNDKFIYSFLDILSSFPEELQHYFIINLHLFSEIEVKIEELPPYVFEDLLKQQIGSLL